MGGCDGPAGSSLPSPVARVTAGLLSQLPPPNRPGCPLPLPNVVVESRRLDHVDPRRLGDRLVRDQRVTIQNENPANSGVWSALEGIRTPGRVIRRRACRPWMSGDVSDLGRRFVGVRARLRDFVGLGPQMGPRPLPRRFRRRRRGAFENLANRSGTGQSHHARVPRGSTEMGHPTGRDRGGVSRAPSCRRPSLAPMSAGTAGSPLWRNASDERAGTSSVGRPMTSCMRRCRST